MATPGLSPARRAWLRFRRNRLGYWSLLVFCLLVLASLFAELVSNDRPLLVRYEGTTYFPIVKDYSEKTFGGDFDTTVLRDGSVPLAIGPRQALVLVAR